MKTLVFGKNKEYMAWKNSDSFGSQIIKIAKVDEFIIDQSIIVEEIFEEGNWIEFNEEEVLRLLLIARRI